MSTRAICCGELSVHIAVRHVIHGGALGFCVPVYEDQRRRLLPLFHCPWCGSELQPQGERPAGLSYPAT